MGVFNGNLAAAKQELVDRLNAKISTSIPFIQKRVNLGRGQITKGTRTHGIMHFYVPASGNAQVGQVTGVAQSATESVLDLSKRPRNSSFFKKECYAQNASDILEYSNFEEIFQLDDYQKDLVKPRGEKMAHTIEADIVNRNWAKAGGAIVSDTADFLVLSRAAAELQSIKATGDWTGYISPMLHSYLASSPMRMDIRPPESRVQEMYGKSSIGMFANVDWVSEPFMPIFTAGGDIGSSVTVAENVDTQGADTITLSGVTSGVTIKKGTPIKIKGVYEVTVSGVKQSYEKKLIVQEDATADGSGVTVKVIPIYFNSDDGYTNTVWVDGGKGIPAGAEVTMLVEAGADYYVGLVRDAEAFNWTPFEWPELLALENTTSSTDDLTIQLAAGGEILQRTNVMRMDCPYFGDIIDERAVRTLFVKCP